MGHTSPFQPSIHCGQGSCLQSQIMPFKSHWLAIGSDKLSKILCGQYRHSPPTISYYILLKGAQK